MWTERSHMQRMRAASVVDKNREAEGIIEGKGRTLAL